MNMAYIFISSSPVEIKIPYIFISINEKYYWKTLSLGFWDKVFPPVNHWSGSRPVPPLRTACLVKPAGVWGHLCAHSDSGLPALSSPPASEATSALTPTQDWVSLQLASPTSPSVWDPLCDSGSLHDLACVTNVTEIKTAAQICILYPLILRFQTPFGDRFFVNLQLVNTILLSKKVRFTFGTTKTKTPVEKCNFRSNCIDFHVFSSFFESISNFLKLDLLHLHINSFSD
jgi:hypothetical protein